MSGGGGNSGVTGMLPMAAALAATVMTDGAATPFLAEEMGVSAGTAAALGGGGIGALAGGLTGALTGQNVGRSALMGGIGGLGLGATGGFMGAGDALGSSGSLLSGLGGATGNATQDSAFGNAMNQMATAPNASGGLSSYAQALGSNSQTTGANLGDYWDTVGQQGNAPVLSDSANSALSAGATGANPANPAFTSDPIGWMKNHYIQTALGAGGIYALATGGKNLTQTPGLKTYQPVTAQQMGLANTMSPYYQRQNNAMYNAPGYATGGGINVAPGSVATQGVAPADLMQSQQAQLPTQVQSLMSQYGVSPQEAQQTLAGLGVAQPTAKTMAAGGIANLKEGAFVVPADVVSHVGNGSTDAGMQTLKKHYGASPIVGAGDGMSDNIPATIDGKQPARIANGEAVISPEKVKEIGKGSTDAGAKRLHNMMDKVRQARTGNKKQGKQIKADKYLSA